MGAKSGTVSGEGKLQLGAGTRPTTVGKQEQGRLWPQLRSWSTLSQQLSPSSSPTTGLSYHVIHQSIGKPLKHHTSFPQREKELGL